MELPIYTFLIQTATIYAYSDAVSNYQMSKILLRENKLNEWINMQYIIEGMLLHNKKRTYKICLEFSPKTKEISSLIRGLNIFPRKKSKTERNWGSRPRLRWRWFTRQTWFLQSGQVELDSNHMSMQLTRKQWLHLGNFRNLSPSTTSWR